MTDDLPPVPHFSGELFTHEELQAYAREAVRAAVERERERAMVAASLAIDAAITMTKAVEQAQAEPTAVSEPVASHDDLMLLADEYAVERKRQVEGLPSPKRAALYDALLIALAHPPIAVVSEPVDVQAFVHSALWLADTSEAQIATIAIEAYLKAHNAWQAAHPPVQPTEPVGFVTGWHATGTDLHSDVRLDIRLYSSQRYQFKVGDNIYAHPPVQPTEVAREPSCYLISKDADGNTTVTATADNETWNDAIEAAANLVANHGSSFAAQQVRGLKR